jgi:hypothetical protein
MSGYSIGAGTLVIRDGDTPCASRIMLVTKICPDTNRAWASHLTDCPCAVEHWAFSPESLLPIEMFGVMAAPEERAAIRLHKSPFTGRKRWYGEEDEFIRCHKDLHAFWLRKLEWSKLEAAQ